ncbi:VOC family protein [Actinophytocola glycyrrhizae]|uniref:VOC family protein n=1 Tax=Actinophytocola glycyrrhizae TaxID=2044873 RepID=A0ABV9RUW0_9PSEU
MRSRMVATVFDCRDTAALAAFWCAALDFEVTDRWHDAHGTEYVEATADGEHMLLFHPVPDRKQAKNRVHLDIRAEGPQYDEVARLVALGGRVVADDPAVPWVVLQDPEGNEFCVLPPESGEQPGSGTQMAEP